MWIELAFLFLATSSSYFCPCTCSEYKQCLPHSPWSRMVLIPSASSLHSHWTLNEIKKWVWTTLCHSPNNAMCRWILANSWCWREESINWSGHYSYTSILCRHSAEWAELGGINSSLRAFINSPQIKKKKKKTRR